MLGFCCFCCFWSDEIMFCKLFFVHLEMYEIEKYFLKNPLITSSGNDFFLIFFLYSLTYLLPAQLERWN